MKVVEQMLSRYAREEDHHALRGKQGHSLGKTGTLPNIPFAGCAVGTMVDHRAGTGDSGNWGQSPYFLHISRKNIGSLVENRDTP